MPFQGENIAAKETQENLGGELESSSEDIRLTLFIASSSFIIMALITIIGVVSCVILCNDDDLSTPNLLGNDSQELYGSYNITSHDNIVCFKQATYCSNDEEYLIGGNYPEQKISQDCGTLQMSGSLAGHLMNQPSMVIFPKPEKDEVIRIQECKTPSPVPRQNPDIDDPKALLVAPSRDNNGSCIKDHQDNREKSVPKIPPPRPPRKNISNVINLPPQPKNNQESGSDKA